MVLPGIDLDRDLLPRLHAVEVDRRRQRPDRAVVLVPAQVVGEDLGIHQVAAEVLVIDARRRRPAFLRSARSLSRSAAAITAPGPLGRRRPRPSAPSSAAPAASRPAAGRDCRASCRRRSRGRRPRPPDPRPARGVRPCATIISAMSPTTLEDGVTLTMSPNIWFTSAYICADLVPALLEAHRAGLRLEVGELAARHLVEVDLGGRRLQPGLEGRVLDPHRLPVVARSRGSRAMSSPVSRSVCRSASTIEPRQGCEVPPEKASIAASTASTPASRRGEDAAPPRCRWCRGCGNGPAGRPPPSAP